MDHGDDGPVRARRALVGPGGPRAPLPVAPLGVRPEQRPDTVRHRSPAAHHVWRARSRRRPRDPARGDGGTVHDGRTAMTSSAPTTTGRQPARRLALIDADVHPNFLQEWSTELAPYLSEGWRVRISAGAAYRSEVARLLPGTRYSMPTNPF